MDAIIAALEAASDAAAQRKAAQAQAQAAAAGPQPAAPAVAAAPVVKKAHAAHSKGTHQAPAPAPAPVRDAAPLPLQAIFEDGNTLLRAIVASEVLQPPLALRENAHWIEAANGP